MKISKWLTMISNRRFAMVNNITVAINNAVRHIAVHIGMSENIVAAPPPPPPQLYIRALLTA